MFHSSEKHSKEIFLNSFSMGKNCVLGRQKGLFLSILRSFFSDILDIQRYTRRYTSICISLVLRILQMSKIDKLYIEYIIPPLFKKGRFFFQKIKKKKNLSKIKRGLGDT